MIFALGGNQNCGKTTLFNQLTGSNQHVGNFPGVTVEGKSGIVKGHPDVKVVDLPGIYSLSPYTAEEIVTRDFLLNEKIDCIINITDATNIERNLYLSLQLMELDIPMVIALNMMDEMRENGNTIKIKQLSEDLGVPVVPLAAVKNEGVDELEKVTEYMRAFGIEEDYFTIDLTIARGLDYYTGTVYETVLDDYRGLGSVCSGGRYDNLTGYYTNNKMPGIGISIGLTRLFSQLKDAGIIKAEKASLTDCLVLPMNIDLSYALKTASEIRKAGFTADCYYANKGMKHKMKYANKLGIPFVAVIGEDEVNSNTVALKNMATGEQVTVELENIGNEIKKQIGDN